MLARHQHRKSVFKLRSSRDLPPNVRANLDHIVFCAPEDSPLYRELREKHIHPCGDIHQERGPGEKLL